MSEFVFCSASFALGWLAATIVYLTTLLSVVCWRILTDE